jgi:hypothetical protein
MNSEIFCNMAGALSAQIDSTRSNERLLELKNLFTIAMSMTYSFFQRFANEKFSLMSFVCM